MKPGDTFDVPLHVRIESADEEPNGDTRHSVMIVCNGSPIVQLEIVFFEEVNPTEPIRRDMIRRSVAACLAEAVNQAGQANQRVRGDIPEPTVLN